VRHQRIGRDRQHFIEDEQGQQVGRERHAHGRHQRNRETGIEPGLVLLVVAAHVADRIDRIDDPQSRGKCSKQHAQRLYLEGDGQPWKHLDEVQLRPPPGIDDGQQAPYVGCQQHGGGQRHGFAQVRPTPGKSHTECAHERDQQ
jgi:hypothetical protein